MYLQFYLMNIEYASRISASGVENLVELGGRKQ